MPPASRERGDQFWVSSTRDVHLASTPIFGMLTVDDAGPRNWLGAGRVWQRMQLWATGHELSMQPLDQSLQPAEREQSTGLRPAIGPAVADLVGASSAALPFRLGYPAQASAPSPRRSVASVLLEV